MQELYTELFVDLATSHAELMVLISRICSAPIEHWTVICGPFQVDVRPNESRGVETDLTPEDRFLDFPFTVEIFGDRGEGEQRYLQLVARIMMDLHTAGASIVAASDFEQELPGAGRLG